MLRPLRLTAELETPIAGPHDLHADGMLMAVHRNVEDAFITRASPKERILRFDHVHHPSPAVLGALSEWRDGSGWMGCVGVADHLVPLCTAMEGEWDRGVEYFARRKDAVDVEEMTARFTRGSGPGRDMLLPIPTKEAASVHWDFLGRRRDVLSLTRGLAAIGAMRRQGYGRVRRWTCEEIPSFSLLDAEGRTRRHLPVEACVDPERVDQGASEPPYWHHALSVARVPAGSKVSRLIRELTC